MEFLLTILNCFYMSPSWGKFTGHHKTLSSICHPCQDFVKSGFAFFLSLLGAWHVPCLVLLPFQRTLLWHWLQGQGCRMKQHCNTGGNKCLTSGLQLYSRVTARALPKQLSKHANTRGQRAVWWNSLFLMVLKRIHLKKHPQINWQLGSLSPQSLTLLQRWFIWNTFLRLYYNVFLQRQELKLPQKTIGAKSSQPLASGHSPQRNGAAAGPAQSSGSLVSHHCPPISTSGPPPSVCWGHTCCNWHAVMAQHRRPFFYIGQTILKECKVSFSSLMINHL